MKTYKIYDMNTDEEITEIRAFSVVEAERKFLKNGTEYGSNDIYALSIEEDE